MTSVPESAVLTISPGPSHMLFPLHGVLFLLAHTACKTLPWLRYHLVKDTSLDLLMPRWHQQPSVAARTPLLCDYILLCPSSHPAGTMRLPSSQLSLTAQPNAQHLRCLVG